MAKKSFKAALSAGSAIINPAEALITGAARVTKTEAGAPSVPEAGTASRKEAKSRRLQSLLKPSLYEWLRASAATKGISVNDRLNALIEAAKAAEG